MDDEWKTISNHQNYEISRKGLIRRKGKDKLLKPFNSNGQYKVNLDGKTEYVSRIVAITFINKQGPSNEVLHKNKNKFDNDVKNLEWATHSEIEDHVLGPYSKMKKYSNQSKPVIVIETGEVFASIRSCAKYFKTEPIIIRRCIAHSNYTCRGFHFKFFKK